MPGNIDFWPNSAPVADLQPMVRSAPKAVLRTAATELPPASFARRAAWVALAGLWVFLFLSLGTFDSADWPSHTVAMHNQPPANLMGTLGAGVAYWIYLSVGFGVWLPMIAGAIGLGVTASGRVITHPLVRAFGAVVMMLAFSALHAAWVPSWGVLAGAESGLVPQWIVGELAMRFSPVLTALVLFISFALGAIVCMDEVVMALPRHVAKAWQVTQPVRDYDWKGLIARFRTRPMLLQPAGAARAGTAVLQPPAETPDMETEVEDEATDLADEELDEVIDEAMEEAMEEDTEDQEESDDADGEADEDGETSDEIEEPAEATASAPRPQLTEEELKAKIARLPLRMAGGSKTVARDEDIPREVDYTGYRFPGLDLLEDPEGNWSEQIEDYVREQAARLTATLRHYAIEGEVTGIETGPVVTLYSVELAPGTRVARLQSIDDDIARALGAPNIRIISNMVGRTAVGIEVPNKQKEKVRLKELMSGGQAQGMTLPMFLGKDSAGEPLVIDLARMPHMLIAGTTGSGKSVCMNTIILGWMYTKRPDELKLCLVDPKMVEMSQFSDIPHLMCPVVTEMAKAAGILEWAVDKMEERYEQLKRAGVRDIGGYNGLGEEELCARLQPATDLEKARIPKKLPYMVFVIDELADLMMTNKEVEQSIVRIAQKARAVGIHLVLATQRPQANVVTGLIKSNMPCRVSFKVASGMDSRIVLDDKGAELLLGQGDMLVRTPSTSELRRAQGTLVTDGETRNVARFLKDVAEPSFERQLVAIRGTKASGGEEPDGGCAATDGGERDPMFERAVDIMIESGRGSVSLLQRRLAIGYGRASRLVDQMGAAGILSDHKGSVAREVLITQDDWNRMKSMVESGGQDDASEDVRYVPDEDAAVPDELEGEYRQ
jgi:S-DNA-T family DNA segregation ATPase FtsK/SpoIIIE